MHANLISLSGSPTLVTVLPDSVVLVSSLNSFKTIQINSGNHKAAYITIKTIHTEQPLEATQKFRNNVIVKKHLSQTIRARRPVPMLVKYFFVTFMLHCLFCSRVYMFCYRTQLSRCVHNEADQREETFRKRFHFFA